MKKSFLFPCVLAIMSKFSLAYVVFGGAGQVPAAPQEKPAAQAGSYILQRSKVGELLEKTNKAFQQRHGRELTQEERKVMEAIIVYNELVSYCKQQEFEKKSMGKNDKYKGMERSLQAQHFQEESMKDLYKNLSREEVMAKSQEVADKGGEFFLQFFPCNTLQQVERIQNGLKYATKNTTFESLVNSIAQEENRGKKQPQKPQSLKVHARLEITLDDGIRKKLSGKKPGDLVVVPQEKGGFLLLYIKDRRSVQADHPDVQKMAVEEIITEKQKVMERKLLQEYKVQFFDEKGEGLPLEDVEAMAARG